MSRERMGYFALAATAPDSSGNHQPDHFLTLPSFSQSNVVVPTLMIKESLFS